MGRVERWRAHGRVRWRIPGFRRGPQSGSPGDVSSTLPKIPDVGFSPVRLQAEASFNQHLPFPEDLRAEAPGPHTLAGLAVRPCLRCLCALLHPQPAFSASPASGHFSNHLGPRVLCSERVLLSLSSSLLRPDPPVSIAPPAFPRTLVMPEAFCPTTWSGLPPRPSLLWVSAPSTRAVTSTPGGEAGPIARDIPASMAFLIRAVSRLLQHSRHRLPSGAHLSTLPSVRSLRPA